MEKHKKELAAKEPKPIKVTLPDGKVMDGQSWRTTPIELAEKIRLEMFKSDSLSFVLKIFFLIKIIFKAKD